MSRIGLFVGVGAEDQDSRRVKLSCLEHEAIEEGSNRVYVGGLRLIKPGGIMSPISTPTPPHLPLFLHRAQHPK